jgi:hypothetical protein
MKIAATISGVVLAFAAISSAYSPSASANPSCPYDMNTRAGQEALGQQLLDTLPTPGDVQGLNEYNDLTYACIGSNGLPPLPPEAAPLPPPPAAPVPVTAPAPVAAPAPEESQTGPANGCSDGRCVIYLSNAQTRDLAESGVAGDYGVELLSQAKGNPVLVGALTTLVVGHQVIAKQYADRGWCSKFTASIYPWENQGYEGYPCDS